MGSYENIKLKVVESAKANKSQTIIRQASFVCGDNLSATVIERGSIPVDTKLPLNELAYCLNREIVIESSSSSSPENLLAKYHVLAKLLMVFSGNMLNVKSTEIQDKNGQKMPELSNCCNKALDNSLEYYKPRSTVLVHSGFSFNWMPWLSNELFSKWEKLLKELSIIHQVVLYNVDWSHMPVEICLSHIIEVFEPLIELISEKTKLFTSIKPNSDTTTLRMILDVIISHFGMDIFGEEYADNSSGFLAALVNSRNRIMHVKVDSNKFYLTGEEAVLYLEKLLLLYRHILLNLLGIPYSSYQDLIKEIVQNLNSWEGVFASIRSRKWKIEEKKNSTK